MLRTRHLFRHSLSLSAPRPIVYAATILRQQSTRQWREGKAADYQAAFPNNAQWQRSKAKEISFETSRWQSKEIEDTRGENNQSRAQNNTQAKNDFLIYRELKFLPDPVKLAERVRELLRQDKYDFALRLVHKASVNRNAVVSWNHLISWKLRHKRYKEALSLFNDMKRRRQVPDSHTYSILLKHMGDQPQSSQQALRLYKSYKDKAAPSPPSLFIVNPTLKVCARSFDTERMLELYESLPLSGRGAPDNITYTIVFDGLFASLKKKLDNITKPAGNVHKPEKAQQISTAKEIKDAIEDADGVFADVLKRWSSGDLFVDEALVLSYCRFLALGDIRSQDLIFDILHKVLGVSRLLPHIGSSEWKETDPSLQGQENSSTDLTERAVGRSEGEDTDDYADHRPVDMRTMLAEITPSSQPISGNKTLTLILEILGRLKQKKFAKQYWDKFVQEQGSGPDEISLREYLRILRLARSGSQALEAVETVNSSLMPSTYRIAMSAIRRDVRNVWCFSNADKLVRMTLKVLHQPDARMLTDYLEIARRAPVSTASEAQESDMIATDSKDTAPKPFERIDLGIEKTTRNTAVLIKEKTARGQQILQALTLISKKFRVLRATLSYGMDESLTKSEKAIFDADSKDEAKRVASVKRKERQIMEHDILHLFQSMIGAYDYILNEGLIERDSYRPLVEERSRIASVVSTKKRHMYNQKKVAEKAKHQSQTPIRQERSEDTFDEDTKLSDFASAIVDTEEDWSYKERAWMENPDWDPESENNKRQ